MIRIVTDIGFDVVPLAGVDVDYVKLFRYEDAVGLDLIVRRLSELSSMRLLLGQ